MKENEEGTVFNQKRLNANQRSKNSKYKAKSKVESLKKKNTQSKESKQKIKSEREECDLPDNHSRYEILESIDDTIHQADNFEALLNEPLTRDSYFKFKSEQNWDNDIKSQTQLCKYFNLDLNLLSDGISSVPLMKRHNYNEDLFSKSDLNLMKGTANENLRKYKKCVNKIPVAVTETITREEHSKTTLQKTNDSNDVLDFSTSKPTEAKNHPVLERKDVRSHGLHDDLEQWLDDILDD